MVEDSTRNSASSHNVHLLVGFLSNEFTGLQRYANDLVTRMSTSNKIVGMKPPVGFGAPLPIVGGSLLHYFAYPSVVKREVPSGSLVHITSQDFAYIARLRPDLKCLVTCHDLIPFLYEKKHSLFWEFVLKGMVASTKVICISEYTKNCFIEACNQKSINVKKSSIKVIYQGVDLEKFCPSGPQIPFDSLGLPTDAKSLLYVGSEQPRKNFEVVLQTFANLSKAHSNLYLLKAGRPNWFGARRKYRSWLTENNLIDKVRFLNYVPEKLMPALYRTADVLIFPSRMEGFGWPPLEAMACGTPVAVSNSASLPEVVGDAAPKFSYNDVKSFSAFTEKILTDSIFRDKHILKGIERSKDFDIQTKIEEMDSIYDEIRSENIK